MPTQTLPRSSDELEEMLHDPAKSKEVLASADSLIDFIEGYAKQTSVKDDDIERQVREQTQREFANLLRGDQIDRINQANLDPRTDPRIKGNRQYNAKAAGAILDKKFGSWDKFLPAVWERSTTTQSLADRTELTQLQNSLSSVVPSDGGFLIPEVLRAELLRVALESALVRPRARVVPMDSLSVPYPTIDDTTHASSVFGGLTGYWTEEAGALTDSSPSFGRITLMAKKLTLYSEIPNELFVDSIISLQQFIDETWPEGIAWFEDVAFTSGNGAGQPLGYLNADAMIQISAENGQATNTILWENIVKMYSRMLPSSISRAVWIAHIDTFQQLATMALAVGTGGSAVWIGNGGGNLVGAGADLPPVTILGRPVLFTEKVSATGTAGDINFVDLSYYLIGDRQMLQAASSSEYKFQNDKVAFRVIERVDGQPWLRSAITPQTGTNTLSPFVQIATRP